MVPNLSPTAIATIWNVGLNWVSVCTGRNRGRNSRTIQKRNEQPKNHNKSDAQPQPSFCRGWNSSNIIHSPRRLSPKIKLARISTYYPPKSACNAHLSSDIYCPSIERRKIMGWPRRMYVKAKNLWGRSLCPSTTKTIDSHRHFGEWQDARRKRREGERRVRKGRFFAIVSHKVPRCT